MTQIRNILVIASLAVAGLCFAPAFVIPAIVQFFQADLRQTVDSFMSDTVNSIRKAEQAVQDYKQLLTERRRVVGQLEHQQEGIDGKIADVVKERQKQERILRTIREYMEARRPIPCPHTGRPLDDTAVAVQIDIAGAILESCKTTEHGLRQQLKSVVDQMAEYRLDIARGPAQIIELEGAIDVLRMNYAFHKNRLAEIDNGSSLALKDAFRDAQRALTDARSRFDSTLPALTSIAQVFPDDQTGQDLAEQNRQRIAKLLGDASVTQVNADTFAVR